MERNDRARLCGAARRPRGVWAYVDAHLRERASDDFDVWKTNAGGLGGSPPIELPIDVPSGASLFVVNRKCASVDGRRAANGAGAGRSLGGEPPKPPAFSVSQREICGQT
jgi:hypothetical protein